MSNRTIIQYFEWDLPADCGHWDRVREDAAHLAHLGITDVWLPPAYKGHVGKSDVGYGVYDLYDLGEFDQKGSIPTKYGTKEQYIRAIDELHAHGIRVLADVVLNHRMGADYPETVTASKVDPQDRRRKLVEKKRITAWTGFQFPGRRQKYSGFTWNRKHFSGVDYNAKANSNGVYKLFGHRWAKNVDEENGNFDYLMGADVDFSVPEVRQELLNWGKWYFETANLDGVRLDAVKHISSVFFVWWLKSLRRELKKDFFAVGEYWNADLDTLLEYLEETVHTMSLFDVPLHFRFFRAANEGAAYDLRRILDDTLLTKASELSVPFVDNHDTQPGQALESWVGEWFKPLAYALILLRRDGDPCVFYGDLYGLPKFGVGPVRELEALLLARKRYAHGAQTDYFDFPNVIGWTREGGLAAVLSNGDDGWKRMHTGRPCCIYIDALGNRPEEITTDQDGWADFLVKAGSVSVWVPKEP